jgi:tRNA dimethylallyltransferase
VCLVGATASGKTTLGLELASALGAEIVSADSRQVYRRMDIGTAKPTREERARVPHHGLDLVEPWEVFDAARYAAAARQAIDDVLARGRRVLVVGGTGLWVRALLYGLCPAPPRAPALRRVLEAWGRREGSAALHRRLAHLDGVAARRIHPNDPARVVRAIEVALASGRRLSDWQAAHRFRTPRLDALVIGLTVTPDVLDRRIAARLEGMLAAGWLDEVAALRDLQLEDDAPVWRTLGYVEMRSVLEGTATVPDAIARTRVATRRFAKRQRTWFRGEQAVVWRDPAADGARLTAEIAAFYETGRVANPGGGG